MARPLASVLPGTSTAKAPHVSAWISRHARHDRDTRLVRLRRLALSRRLRDATANPITLTRDLAMARPLASVLPGTSTAQVPQVMVWVRGSVGMPATTATRDWCESVAWPSHAACVMPPLTLYPELGIW